MARIFTLNFSFRDKACTALVSIRDNEHNMACIVRYIDPDLHQIIPGGVLTVQLSGQIYCSSNVESEQAAQLISRTSDAICEHLGTDEQRHPHASSCQPATP